MNRERIVINTRKKCLDAALLGILGAMSAQSAFAQSAAPAGSVEIRTVGEAESRSDDPADLQHNRRVDAVQLPSVQPAAPAVTRIALADGGQIWATEDPQLSRPELSTSANGIAAFSDGRIRQPVRFYVRSNYAAFMQRMEIVLYGQDDADFIRPLATVAVPLDNLNTVTWDGALPDDLGLRTGDELVYVVRAYDAAGNFDETHPQRIQLVRPEDVEKQNQGLLNSAGSRELGSDAAQILDRQLLERSFAGNGLRRQNITVYGSRVRLRGEGLPEGAQLRINGESYPVDLQNRFAAEYLLPAGTHRFELQLTGKDGAERTQVLNVPVTGRYFFLVGLADVTLSDSRTGGSVVPAGVDDGYDGFLSEGRLAFYLKGKVRGKYLITAQADTGEQELSRMFNGFLESDPRDVFRRLDPDQYYPVYGDDSNSYRDVDSQGRLYVRVDWDKSQALWGNFHTGLTGTEYGQYSRSLYGAAVDWRSADSTAFGETASELRAFGAQAESAAGHTEFLGTGGSLYYLRHTDLLPGSAKAVLEVRNLNTGRVESRVELVQGADYEIDALQGRLTLSRPLAQIAQANLPSIIRDRPLDGFENRLLVDYEYVPNGFRSEESSVGLRGKHWFGDHVAVGGTYVDESRAGDDYRLGGIDVTLQAARGTYLKFEHAQSESTGAPVFYSDNGGLSFSRLDPVGAGRREGDADSVEARVNFKEMGLSRADWSAGAWRRNVDDGFSVSRLDAGLAREETGAEFAGDLNAQWRLAGRYSDARRGANRVEQSQLQARWRPNAEIELTGELRRATDTVSSASATGTLAALRYGQRINPQLELYGIAQVTLDDDGGAYAGNDAFTAGAKYQFADLSSLGAEYTSGERGDAARVNAEYRVSAERSLYGSYTHAAAGAVNDVLYNRSTPTGFTFGQRWRVSSQLNLFNESQFLKSGEESGIAHAFGLDFYPGVGWTSGFTLQHGELEGAAGLVTRNAYGVHGGRTDQDMSWNSRLEYRRDSGAEQRRQWIGTNRLLYRVNEDLRIALRLNFGDTEDRLDAVDDARFVEAHAGFAYRPATDDRFNLLGRYTYLYDLSSFGQDGLSEFDQRSHVFALEGIYRLNAGWEVAAKLAHRRGEARMARNEGPWFDSRADLWAVQGRYETVYAWDALVEYRQLRTGGDGGTREGWLLGVDRHLNDNLRLGLGYNFTDFSDDLTRLDFNQEGWFLNVVGTY